MSSSDPPLPPSAAAPRRQLGVFDGVCIIVGIIIGAGIYETAPTVAGQMGGPGGVVAIWIVGGLLSLAGALCYAELATAYPRAGGDYVYLARAYGGWAGFLFAWGKLAIIGPGSIAGMAFVFARYAGDLLPAGALGAEGSGKPLLAALAVIVLTAVNALGVREGKWTQNALTTIKAAGLLAIGLVALLAGSASDSATGAGVRGAIAPASPAEARELTASGLNLALILVLFTYGGWNEIAYVAAEVRDARRNILRALVAGTLSVTALYLLVNIAFLHTLGYEGTAGSSAVARDAVARVFEGRAGTVISLLVCLSALGAVNGMVLTGARVSWALGRDYPRIGWLGRWSPALGTPLNALLLQGAITTAIVLAAGSFVGAVTYTSAVVWTFFLATGVAVFVLRRVDADVERPYRVTGHPVTTILFCLSSAFLVWSSVAYDWRKHSFLGTAVALAVLAAGLPVHFSGHRSASGEGGEE